MVLGGFRSFHVLVFTLSCVKGDVYVGCWTPPNWKFLKQTAALASVARGRLSL